MDISSAIFDPELCYHTAIFDALCACLNLKRTSAAAAALIHEAYAEPENMPRRSQKGSTVKVFPIAIESNSMNVSAGASISLDDTVTPAYLPSGNTFQFVQGQFTAAFFCQ